jgi:pSer/pThr/pTyr-binding forkhead associated (FHA) protein
MIQCPNCARENAESFNFCLDCGYDLKAWREAKASAPGGTPTEPITAYDSQEAQAQARGLVSPTPVSSIATRVVDVRAPTSVGTAAAGAGFGPTGTAPASPAAATVPPAPAEIVCGSCGARVPASMRFCGSCGKRLDGAGPDAQPAAARTMFMHASDALAGARERICKLVAIDQHGKEGMTFTIKSGETLCGRVNGVVLFMDDPFVSPTHCLFRFKDGVLRVLDQRSLNGVYARVRAERKLLDGDYLRVGRQLFRFELLTSAAMQVKRADGDDAKVWGSPDPGSFGRLVQILEDGRTGEIRLLQGERAQIGREQGDIVLPMDGFVSGRHCTFTRRGDDVVLADLGSSNGTYVRVRGEADVANGDFLLVGNQMLRVEIA